MADRRRSRRWPRQLDVRFWKRGEEGEATRAVSTNVSQTGIFLRTPQVLPNGTRMRLEVSCAGRSFIAEGVVMRALKTPQHLQAAMPSGMGVRFLRIEELLEDLLPGINLLTEELVPAAAPSQPGMQPVAASSTRAYAAGPAPVPAPSPAASLRAPNAQPIVNASVFPLRFRDREQFERAFARDIQTGGLFISTDRPPPMDALIDVEVSVDGLAAPAVRLQARVVHRLVPPADEPGGNLLAGAGVQFVDVTRAVEQLRALLAR